MLLFLFTIVLLDVIINLSYEDPLKNNYYPRKYIRNNKYKRRNDYNYKDWEEKKQDYYDIMFSTTSDSEVTTSLPHTISFPTISTDVTYSLTISKETVIATPYTLTSIPTSSLVTSTTTSSSFLTSTSPPLTSTTSISIDTTISSPEATTTSTTTTTVSSKDETTIVPEVTTDDVFNSNFTIIPSTLKPIENHIVYEIKRIKKERREGSFTASLLLLLEATVAKDPQQLNRLLNAMNTEVMRLNKNHQLMMFGSDVEGRITLMSVGAASSDVEQVRATLTYVYNCITNRRSGSLYHEINAIMDITDNIYNEDDIRNAADVIRDVLRFPDISKSPEDLAKDMGEAFVFKPYKRILGTTKERLLLMEIDNAVEKLVKSERGMRRNDGETKYQKKTATTKSIMDYIIESNYVTNKEIMKELKQKMKKYKRMKKMEKIKKRKRGKTTRNPITPRPEIVKSKYFIRKYSRKNLSKMRTTTKRTISTRDEFKYYGKIRKKKVTSRRNVENKYKSRSYCEESGEDYYSDEVDDDVSSDDDAKYGYTDIMNTPASKFGRKTLKSLDLSDSNEEVKLKVNLRDALIHSGYKNMGERRVNERSMKWKENDDELTLKRNIYNAFGYKNFGLVH